MATSHPDKGQEGGSVLWSTVNTITRPDLVCFSHLRWDFVYQRPQHLLERAASDRRVFYCEEPVPHRGPPELTVRRTPEGPWVVVPLLPVDAGQEEQTAMLRDLVDRLIADQGIQDFVAWYYTPAALRFSGHLSPAVTVYDCMDELSLFKGADPILVAQEDELFARAGVVFTGGQGLFDAKRGRHEHVYLFPSSIDRAHFAQARRPLPDPHDQAGLSHPRLGYFGVIDERMDLALVDGLAAARPQWEIVLVGPVAKINEADLPRRANIYCLGPRPYQQLPAYLSGWDVALLPFACNEATCFISPTKTPEYLAGGVPVVSTAIRDVIRPYGQLGLVRIAETLPDFVAAVEVVLQEGSETRQEWRQRVDAHLQQNSWDRTWAAMAALIDRRAATGNAARSEAGRTSPQTREESVEA